ncbi:hypothetical protein Pan258_20320 [Symmachiella dynata]|uniref:Uncharacterized protein n=1 Tax=Symmachiella dynata TaxID=2527995 RepID=A0A517ZM83_9PLAN|nr:hypothetical protein [Symmachiella dynata]QDT47992.1 hypothetical protein Pan258_20320 [Symmachiella dynata]QDU43593.1 hypothetical protein Mal52_20690 [Symmachiella dynata]
MSFDLFLVTFRDGSSAPADDVAARAVLDSFEYDFRPKFQAYEITVDDGKHLEFSAGGLHDDDEFSGGMFALHDFSRDIMQFIYEFSKAAGSVIFPAMDPPCILIPRDDLLKHLPEDFPSDFTNFPINSGEEMLIVLKEGYDAWSAFRDRVRDSDVGDNPSSNDI